MKRDENNELPPSIVCSADTYAQSYIAHCAAELKGMTTGKWIQKTNTLQKIAWYWDSHAQSQIVCLSMCLCVNRIPVYSNFHRVNWNLTVFPSCRRICQSECNGNIFSFVEILVGSYRFPIHWPYFAIHYSNWYTMEEPKPKNGFDASFIIHYSILYPVGLVNEIERTQRRRIAFDSFIRIEMVFVFLFLAHLFPCHCASSNSRSRPDFFGQPQYNRAIPNNKWQKEIWRKKSINVYFIRIQILILIPFLSVGILAKVSPLFHTTFMDVVNSE